jgi:hypothetical protein
MISQLLDLDYMGAAEFEFGAIPRTILNYANELRKPDFADAFFTFDVERLGKTFLVHCLSSQVDEVRAYVEKFEHSDSPGHLHESLHLNSKPDGYGYTDFWFDLENFFYFTTGKVDDLYKFREAIFNSEQTILKNRGEEQIALQLREQKQQQANTVAIQNRDKRHNDLCALKSGRARAHSAGNAS